MKLINNTLKNLDEELSSTFIAYQSLKNFKTQINNDNINESKLPIQFQINLKPIKNNTTNNNELEKLAN